MRTILAVLVVSLERRSFSKVSTVSKESGRGCSSKRRTCYRALVGYERTLYVTYWKEGPEKCRVSQEIPALRRVRRGFN